MQIVRIRCYFVQSFANVTKYKHINYLNALTKLVLCLILPTVVLHYSVSHQTFVIMTHKVVKMKLRMSLERKFMTHENKLFRESERERERVSLFFVFNVIFSCMQSKRIQSHVMSSKKASHSCWLTCKLFCVTKCTTT